jgi:hypothetical protein
MTYEVRCGLTGDEAQASTPEGALLAAATLVEDAVGVGDLGRDRLPAARHSILILAHGRSDCVLTRAAHDGIRAYVQVAA